MKKIKILSVALASLLILFCTTSWVSPKPVSATPGAVTITGWYDFSTFPNTKGTFSTTGALTISGTSTMDVNPIMANGRLVRAHCVVVLTPSDGSGTITIHQECVYVTTMPKGRWEIVSGTGAYANLKGNGPLTMPMQNGLFGEAMTGSIY